MLVGFLEVLIRMELMSEEGLYHFDTALCAGTISQHVQSTKCQQ